VLTFAHSRADAGSNARTRPPIVDAHAEKSFPVFTKRRIPMAMIPIAPKIIASRYFTTLEFGAIALRA
jgi:hypothetical protein